MEASPLLEGSSSSSLSLPGSPGSAGGAWPTTRGARDPAVRAADSRSPWLQRHRETVLNGSEYEGCCLGGTGSWGGLFPAEWTHPEWPGEGGPRRPPPAPSRGAKRPCYLSSTKFSRAPGVCKNADSQSTRVLSQRRCPDCAEDAALPAPLPPSPGFQKYHFYTTIKKICLPTIGFSESLTLSPGETALHLGRWMTFLLGTLQVQPR